MSSAVKCPKCGHIWVPRVTSGVPVECPVCQVNFKEGFVPQPLHLPSNLDKEDRDADSRMAFSTTVFGKQIGEASEEERAKLKAKYLAQAEAFFDAKTKNKVIEHLQDVFDKAVTIQFRLKKWQVKPSLGSRTEAVNTEWLEQKLQGTTYRQKLEGQRDEEQDLLETLRLFDANAERERINREHDESEKKWETPHGYTREQELEFMEKDKKTVNEALPMLTKIIAVYDKRIEELKKWEKEDEPLLPKKVELEKTGQKLVDEIRPLLQAYSRARMFADEGQKKELMKKLRDRIAKHTKLEEEYNQFASKFKIPRNSDFPSLPNLVRYLDKDVKLLVKEGQK